jgi:integrase
MSSISTCKARILSSKINLGYRPYFVRGDDMQYITDGHGAREIAYHTDRIVKKFPLIYCLPRLELCCELNLFLFQRYTGEFSMKLNKNQDEEHRSTAIGKPIGLKTVRSLADSLLPFVNWLVIEGADWQEVIAEPLTITEDSLDLVPIWRYRNYVYKKVKAGELAYSTGRNRVNVVTSFYQWSHLNKRIGILPFEMIKKIIPRKRKDGGLDMLMGMSLAKTNGLPIFTTSMALPRSITQKKATPADKLTPYRNDELALLMGSDVINKNDTYRLWAKLGYMVGLREFECVVLNRDFVKNPAESNQPGWYLTFKGKFAKERTVFITRQLMQELWNYTNTKQYGRRINKFQLENGVDSAIPLFINNRGNRMSDGSPGNIIDLVRSELEAKGLPRLCRSFHDLRSTFATNLAAYLIKAGKSESYIKYKLMSLLGHNDFESTRQYINFVNNDGFEKTMLEWVESIYGSAKELLFREG